MILKIVPKAGYDMYTREDRPMTAKESRNRNSEAAFGTSSELVSVFKEASRYFLSLKTLKTNCAYTENTDII